MIKGLINGSLRILRKLYAKKNIRNMAILRQTGPLKGKVLLSWGTLVYEGLKAGKPIASSHESGWLNFQIARCFLDLGYGVDVIRYDDQVFKPVNKYDFLLDVEMNLERLAPYVGKDCVKILYTSFAHWSIHNSNSYKRHLNLIERRGIALKPMRLLRPHLSVENSEYIICPGGEFSKRSFSYRQTPIISVAQITRFSIAELIIKEFESCKRRFVWFSGAGPVHKGLDIVLEAFSQMPDFHLTVCGSLEKSQDFKSAYHKELYETENIQTVGWVDLDQLTDIASRSVGMLHASASEVSCASVIGSMSAGLIPVGTEGNDIDVDGFGVLMKNDSVDAVKEAVQEVSEKSAGELKTMSRRAWEVARQRYGKKKFLQDFRKCICRITGERAAAVWEEKDYDEIRVPKIDIIEAPQ